MGLIPTNERKLFEKEDTSYPYYIEQTKEIEAPVAPVPPAYAQNRAQVPVRGAH